jgi:hypothetical protein
LKGALKAALKDILMVDVKVAHLADQKVLLMAVWMVVLKAVD